MLLPFHSKLVKIYVKESFEPAHSIIEHNLSSIGKSGSTSSVLHYPSMTVLHSHGLSLQKRFNKCFRNGKLNTIAIESTGVTHNYSLLDKEKCYAKEKNSSNASCRRSRQSAG